MVSLPKGIPDLIKKLFISKINRFVFENPLLLLHLLYRYSFILSIVSEKNNNLIYAICLLFPISALLFSKLVLYISKMNSILSLYTN